MCTSATVQLKYGKLELLSKRLSQYLTSSGSKKLINEGKIFVNGKAAQKNALITKNCIVTINEPQGTCLNSIFPQLWIACKPRGVDASDIDKFILGVKPTLKIPKLIAINRLNKYSQGTILMTNHGSFSNKIKEYEAGLSSVFYLKVYCQLHEAMAAVNYLKRTLPTHWISLVKQRQNSIWLKCVINDFTDKNIIEAFRTKNLMISKLRLERIGPYKATDMREILPVKLTNNLFKIAKSIDKGEETLALVPSYSESWPPRIITPGQPKVLQIDSNNIKELPSN